MNVIFFDEPCRDFVGWALLQVILETTLCVPRTFSYLTFLFCIPCVIPAFFSLSFHALLLEGFPFLFLFYPMPFLSLFLDLSFFSFFSFFFSFSILLCIWVCVGFCDLYLFPFFCRAEKARKKEALVGRFTDCTIEHHTLCVRQALPLLLTYPYSILYNTQ